MYDFLDRRIAELDPGGRILVWAMRQWVEALHGGQCPAARIGPTFLKWRVLPALPHFHIAMMILARDGLETLPFAPRGCERVSEGEALILALVRTGHGASIAEVDAMAALLVTSGSVQAMRAALRALSGHLAEFGLIPERPGLHSLSNGAAEE